MYACICACVREGDRKGVGGPATRKRQSEACASPLQKSPSSFGEAGAGVSSGWMETCLRAGDCDAAV
eukprot:4323998-Pleurochrysis_carterae.AAC.4